ncbi:unnamed protein product [Polarella glacialis]|uniref:Uncharacterized protein n=1 Tax=Polarella glacialis TaxID=89957 RepID=A0A813EU89_POLGL|nr:unnamed protein product [Polarella glacialis]CAE8603890.1 unnamed protein product [Polarella glacialis]
MAVADASTRESRLFETVRLIREWIEASFQPAGAERFRKAGRLKARFDVDLGDEMCKQLQAYMRASFALSGLQLQLAERPITGSTKTKPCVEVLMTAAARDLYAEKHPEAAGKRRSPLSLGDDVGDSLPALGDHTGEPLEPAAATLAAAPATPAAPSATKRRLEAATGTPPPKRVSASGAAAVSQQLGSAWGSNRDAVKQYTVLIGCYVCLSC